MNDHRNKDTHETKSKSDLTIETIWKDEVTGKTIRVQISVDDHGLSVRFPKKETLYESDYSVVIDLYDDKLQVIRMDTEESMTILSTIEDYEKSSETDCHILKI